MEYTIFTDGSSRGNPGLGGWGAVVIHNSQFSMINETQDKKNPMTVTELGGAEKHTTNNRMEIMAALQGISMTEEGSSIIIYTDSSYLINSITKWIHGWKRNGWQTKAKEDVLNKDLWIRLAEQIEGKKIQWKYVGGHIGIPGNERCDRIATAFADGEKMHLYKGPLNSYDLPNILTISQDVGKAPDKKSSSSHSKAPAYSYISSVGGVIEVHHTWAECEKRVKGVKGARFKKSTSIGDEARIIEEFEA